MFMRKADAKPLEALMSNGTARAAPPPVIELAAQAAPPPLPGATPQAHAFQSAVNGGHPPHEPSQSMIGQDLTIEGQGITIRCRGALQVNGSIHAELHSKALVVGETGKVEGSITAETVDIWGRVSGAIMGARVMLHAGADVEGDIHARSLSVADGASFEGRSRKVADPATIAPQLEPGTPRHPPDEPLPLPLGAV